MSHPSASSTHRADSRQGAGHATMPLLVRSPASSEAQADSTVTAQPQRAPRQAPPNRPIPTHGWPAFRYAIHRAIGRPDLVPDLNKKDQLEHDIAECEDALRELAARHQITVSFVNTKGSAAKTTLAVHVCSVIAQVTRRMVWIMPATESTSNSTMSIDTGMSPVETYTVTEFYDEVRKGVLPDYRTKSQRVRPTRAGVRVLLEDPARTPDFDLPKFARVYDALVPDADFIALDHANGTISVGSVAHEAASRSHVIVFTATENNPVTHVMLVKTVDNFGDPLQEEDQIARLIDPPFMVMNGVTKRRPYRQGKLGAYGDQLLEVPWDKYIGQIHPQPADLDRISRETYLAYLRVAIAIYVEAANRMAQTQSVSGEVPDAETVTVIPEEVTPAVEKSRHALVAPPN